MNTKQWKCADLNAQQIRLANEQPPFDLKASAPYSNDVMRIRWIVRGMVNAHAVTGVRVHNVVYTATGLL